MKKADVKVGETYRVKVSGKVQDVQLIAECDHGGWYGTNKTTGRAVRIKTAAKLRGLSSAVKSAADLLKQRKQLAKAELSSIEQSYNHSITPEKTARAQELLGEVLKLDGPMRSIPLREEDRPAKHYRIKLPDGYARKDVMEGWIGTYIVADAHQFNTFDEAQQVAQQQYPRHSWGPWNIEEF